MKIHDLVHSCDIKDVLTAMYRSYDGQEGNEEGYLSAFEKLRSMPPTPREDGMRCVIEMVRDEDAGAGEEPYAHVNGMDAEGEAWSLSFIPWREWLDMEVIRRAGMEYASDPEVLAHILWEMTFYGYEEEEVGKIEQDILSMKRDIESGTAKTVPWEDIEAEGDLARQPDVSSNRVIPARHPDQFDSDLPAPAADAKAALEDINRWAKNIYRGEKLTVDIMCLEPKTLATIRALLIAAKGE